VALGQAYLRENIQYTLGEREEAGLRRYYQLAEKHGVVESIRAPEFY
jgi:predicted solute-binding protein